MSDRRPLANLLLLFPCAVLAGGEEGAVPPVGFARDSDYAERLTARNQREAASWVLEQLKKSAGLTDAQKGEIAFHEANIAVSAFENEKEFDKAKAQYDAAKAGLDGYIKLAPGGAFAEKARYAGGDLDRKLGEKITLQITRESSAEKVGELRKLGEEAFRRAIAYFNDRASKLAGAAAQNGPESKEAQELLSMKYAVPNTYLSFAELYPPGDAQRADKLKTAAERFEEFTLDCDPQVRVFYLAHVKWGNACRDLGDTVKAMEVYEIALGLLYDINPDTNEKSVRDPQSMEDVERSLILDTAVEVSKLKNATKAHDDVVNLYNDIKKAMPDLEKLPSGEFFIEVAKAYEAQGKNDKAIDAAQKVLRTASFDRPAYRAAQSLLDALGVSQGNRQLTREQLTAPPFTAMNDGKFAEAMRLLDRSRLLVRGTPDEAKFGAALEALGGMIQEKAGRLLESVLLFESVAERYPKDKIVPDALLQAVQGACTLWLTTKADFPEAKINELVEKLDAGFPGSPQALQAQQLAINTALKLGKKNAMEGAEAEEKQASAMPKTDPKYARRMFEAGKKYVTAGETATGNREALRVAREKARTGSERCFKQFLETISAQQTIDPAEQQSNDERSVQALISMAKTWLWDPPGANPEQTLSIVGQLEERALKSAKAKARSLDFEELKIRANLRLGKLDVAINVVDGMATKQPDARKTVDAQKRVAGAIWDELKGNAAKLAPDRKASLIDQAIRLYGAWIRNGEKQPGLLDSVDYDLAGARLVQLGLMKNGVEMKESFNEVDTSKLAFKDSFEAATEFFEKALTANESSPQASFVPPLVRFRRAQTLGLLGRWKELADEYDKLVRDADLLDSGPTGYTIKSASATSTRLPAAQILNERALALAQLAEKGDKKAGTEAQKLAQAVIKATDPGGAKEPPRDFWVARYIAVLAAFNNGEREAVRQATTYYRTTDKELDKGKWGMDKKIKEIEDKVK